MAVSKATEVRNRSQESEKLRQQAPSSSNDESLEPDYVLVFADTSKAEITKAYDTLSDAGYYVSLQRGSSATILVLVRAGPGLVASKKSRDIVVQQTLPLARLSGVIDSFPVRPKKLPEILASNTSGILSTKLAFTDSQIDAIESIYGGSVAAVFELGNFMLRALVYPTALGIPAYYMFGSYTMSFCIALITWGTLVVAYWRDYVERAQRNHTLTPSTKRTGYQGTPKEQIELRRLLFIPFALLLLLMYAAGLLAVLSLEVFCKQLYDGPLKPIVRLVPAVANVAASQIYGIIYKKAVDKFTNWEDYPTEEELKATKAQRQFYLQALLGYLPIILTAYVYLPFGHLMIDVLKQLRGSPLGYRVSLVSKFELNQGRLLGQATFYTLQMQIITLLINSVIPPAMYAFKRYVLHKADGTGNSRFALDQLRVPFDPTSHLQSVVLSFGYVMILAPVWPLAGLTTLAGLYLRSKCSAYMLLNVNRKPAAQGTTRSIGFWSDELQLLLIMSSLIAPTITVMYGKTNNYYDSSTSLVHVSWLTVLLVALISENYTLFVSHVASKVYHAFDLPNQSSTSTSSATPVITKEQDDLWKTIDIESELSRLHALKPSSAPKSS